MRIYSGAPGAQKRALALLELELQPLGTPLMWVLGSELQSRNRAASAQFVIIKKNVIIKKAEWVKEESSHFRDQIKGRCF